MANYLIEFRLRGFAKKYAQELIREIGRKFRVKGMKDKVSHITLYGKFTTNNERKMVSEVLGVCRKYSRIYFSIKGVNYFNNPSNKVLYLEINPSEDFKKFREELSFRLKPFTKTESKEDRKNKENFIFHSTIAFKDIDYKFNQILSHLKSKNHPKIRQTLLRTTILKNGKILYEYDFLLRKLLDRKQSLNKQIFRETIRRLKQQPTSQKVFSNQIKQSKEMTIFDKIKSFFGVK